MTAALQRIQAAGATLNLEKCEFAKSEILFLGHHIDKDGIRADPAKTAAIMEMQPPTNISELRRFMGMVNQLGKFSKDLADYTQPLRVLLSKKNAWTWGEAQDQAFSRVKMELSRPTVLALYDPQAETKVSADALSFGLGVVLLQKSEAQWKPVAFASRSMSDTERRYAQVEKEALACTWACEKFSSYILGMKFLIETDHKPLIPLLGVKQLDSLPPRVLRFRLRLARFNYSIAHVPGKQLYTADTLSRAPLRSCDRDVNLEEEADALMEVLINHLPISEKRLGEYCNAQASDPICSAIMNYCQNGWPAKESIPPEIKPYWSARGQLTVSNNLLVYGSQIVVPKAMQQVTLQKIHEGHQGILRSRQRAKTSVWWPGIQHQITNLVKQCQVCAKKFTPRSEPLIPSTLPQYPWQKIASDLFVLKGVNYLLVVDYFSRYPEVVKLTTTTSSSIIQALKAIFSRHGIPETVVSDNGPQYSSQEFAEFASTYDFCHVTSSPHFPQSNGQAERGVKTVKTLLADSKDPYMALLSYRTTPFPWCNLSPAQLLMGRCLRNNLPILEEQLIPKWTYLETFQRQNDKFKNEQKQNYDRHHRVQPLPLLPDNTDVWITTEGQKTQGQVVSQADAPRSYLVDTPTGQIRRNRRHLNKVPDSSSVSTNSESISNTPSPNVIMTRSRTGTTIRPPQTLIIDTEKGRCDVIGLTPLGAN